MKKIMILAALVLSFAGTSQAALYYWGVEASTQARPFYDNGDKVYVMLASDWTDSITLKGVQDVAFGVGADKTVGTDYVKSGTTKGKIGTTYFDDGTADKTGTELDVLFVQVNTDGKYFKWEETLTSALSTDPDAQAANLRSFTGSEMAGFSAGGYHAFGVPEPTSGLLLLLGVAGLALRRRRA